MTLNNQVAAEKFPFKLNENNIVLPEFFKTNLDYQISFEKSFESLDFFYSNCSFTLNKSDYSIFVDYIYNKIQKSKLKFNIDLLIYGNLKAVIGDITSNIHVNYSDQKYTISFDLAIYSKFDF